MEHSELVRELGLIGAQLHRAYSKLIVHCIDTCAACQQAGELCEGHKGPLEDVHSAYVRLARLRFELRGN